MYPILKRQILTPDVFLLEISAPFIAKKAQAGQFVIVVPTNKGERVPFTLANWDQERGTITLVIQVLGKTSALLKEKNLKSLAHVSGPLGEPSNIDAHLKKVWVTGGGLGIAAMYPIMRAYHQNKAEVSSFLGYRTKSLVFWEEEIKSQCTHFSLSTNDGSQGEKGLITQSLKKALDNTKPSLMPQIIYTIGPLPMMKAVADLTRTYSIKTIASLNPIMVDGIGMCGACRVTVNGQVRYACIQGPEFDAHQVDFDELIKRNAQFKEQEDLCYREFMQGKNL